MDHTLYTTRDDDHEGADRCGGCPARLALAHERDLTRRLIRGLATTRGLAATPEVVALEYGVTW